MIERYFTISADAPISKDLLAYIENRNKLNKIMKEFAKQEGIEAHEYWAANKQLGIVPTSTDETKFATQLKKDTLDGGLRIFKKNSDIGKKWAVAVAGFDDSIKPQLWMYYHNLPLRVRSRLFEIDGVVYCSIECEAEYTKPDDFTEMKGSVFFKVIEDFEERIKNES